MLLVVEVDNRQKVRLSMKVNRNIYPLYYPPYIPSGWAGTNDWNTLVNSGKVSLNIQYDQSIFPAVATNYVNKGFFWYRDDDRKVQTLDTYTQQFVGIGYRWLRTGLGDPLFRTIYNQRVAYGAGSANSNSNIFPITAFVPTNVCLMIYVQCYAGIGGEVQDIQFDNYFSGANSNYPYVSAIYAIPYVGSANSRSRDDGFNVYFDLHFPPCTTGDFNYNNTALSPGTEALMYLYGTPYVPTTTENKNQLFWFVGVSNSNLEQPTYKDMPKSYAVGICNSTGLYWTGNTNSAQYSKIGKGCVDPLIHLGTLTDDGKLTGDGSTGSDTNNERISNFTNADDYFNNGGFNGYDNTDPNNYTDKIDLNKPKLSTVNVFNRTFAVNNTSVTALADFLWNADETKFDEIIKGLGLMGENPMNGLIDLRLYPFDVATKNNVTSAQSIVIGRTDTGVNGIKLTGDVNALIDLGSCSFFQKFKNFLDYEPYTTAQLYIPYIGVIPVSTAEFMGHNISVKMIVDYITGACTAIVYKDDIPFIYRNGVIGVSIPMTGTDSASYSNSIISSAINTVTQGGNAVADFAGKNIASGISNALGAVGSAYSAFSTPVQYQSAGASSPSVATWQPQNCYFIIDRPVENVPSNYGRTIGYACEETGTLNSFTGFTIVSNPEISFKTTDVEKTMLINMLTGGVFV